MRTVYDVRSVRHTNRITRFVRIRPEDNIKENGAILSINRALSIINVFRHFFIAFRVKKINAARFVTRQSTYTYYNNNHLTCTHQNDKNIHRVIGHGN